MTDVHIVLVQMARDIKKTFCETGVVDYELKKELEEIAYLHGIDVYFDEDDIPEQVEDEPV